MYVQSLRGHPRADVYVSSWPLPDLLTLALNPRPYVLPTTEPLSETFEVIAVLTCREVESAVVV